GKLTGREAPAAHVYLETVKGDVAPADVASFALGAQLRGYKFDKYKSKKAAKTANGKTANGKNGNSADDKALKKIVVHCADTRAAGQAFNPERAILDGVNLARDLVNEPANVLGPAEFATKVKALTKAGVQVEVLS